MRGVDKRRLDKFERQQDFFTEYAADFPDGTPGAEVAAINAAIIAEMRALAGDEISEDIARQTHEEDGGLLGEMMMLLRNMNRAANAFEEEIPGTNKMFRLPRNRSANNLLKAAHDFLTDATPLKEVFTGYGLDETFLTDLQNYITAIESAKQSNDSGDDRQIDSTAGITDAAGRGMKNSRRADAIVRIKFGDDPQKLAAWTVASHLERAPKSRDEG